MQKQRVHDMLLTAIRLMHVNVEPDRRVVDRVDVRGCLSWYVKGRLQGAALQHLAVCTADIPCNDPAMMLLRRKFLMPDINLSSGQLTGMANLVRFLLHRCCGPCTDRRPSDRIADLTTDSHRTGDEDC